MLLLSPSGAVVFADEGPERAGDLTPVAPVAQLRIFNLRNYGTESGFALSPGGKTLAFGSGNVLLVEDLSRPRPPYQQPRSVAVENFCFGNSPLSFLPDGKTVVGISAQNPEDASLRFWDVATGKAVREIDNDEPFVGLAVSPDGKRLALGNPQRIEVWDAASGDEVRVFYRQGQPNLASRVLAFSPDGKMLAAEANEAEVELWEVATGKERQRLRLAIDAPPQGVNFGYQGAAGSVTALAFSGDGALLAAGGSDQAVHLWDLVGNQELPPLVGHQAPVRALTFTPEGKNLVSLDAEGLRLTWRVSRIARAPTGRHPALGDGEFEDLWTDLAEGDAFSTYRAARYLTDDPRRAVALLRRHLRPVPAGDPSRLAQLTADLQSPNAAQRRKAMAELRKQGEAALGPLKQLAAGPQQHRAAQIVIRKLEAQVSPAERARSARAVRILEQIGNDEARQLLDKLAKGAAGAHLTLEAQAAAERLAHANGPARTPADLDALWEDLAADDAARAWRAMQGLAGAPSKALSLLRQRLKPQAALDAGQIHDLLADLDSEEFTVRQKAAARLENLGARAEPALKEALADHPSAEVRRRLGRLLERLAAGNIPPPETLRGLRALEVLERLDPGQRKPILEALARGAPAAPLTQEARAALDRLATRTAGTP
jgi:hypothetical protein